MTHLFSRDYRRTIVPVIPGNAFLPLTVPRDDFRQIRPIAIGVSWLHNPAEAQLKRWFAGGLLVSAVAGLGDTPRRVTDVVVFLLVAGDGVLDPDVRYSARTTVCTIFDQIGVHIIWGAATPQAPPAGQIAILLRFAEPSPIRRDPVRQTACTSPSAFACSWPFSNAPAPVIVVMHERIRLSSGTPQFFKSLLAHVIAHEVTHVLQLRNVHSPTGLMKEHWTGSDFDDMRAVGLGFTVRDIELIEEGVNYRRRAH